MSLDRFKSAQADAHAGFDAALGELRSGRKTSHWIWYIFPQLASLGRSSTARYYGINDFAEALAYLRDRGLHDHLRQVTSVVDEKLTAGIRLIDLLGGPTDSLKLVSSLTLFQVAADKLAATEQESGLLDFSQACERILDAAKCQGYPPCAHTLIAVRPRT